MAMIFYAIVCFAVLIMLWIQLYRKNCAFFLDLVAAAFLGCLKTKAKKHRER